MSPLGLALHAVLSAALLKYRRKHRLVHFVFAHWHIVVSLEQRIVRCLIISKECTLVIVPLHKLVGDELLSIGAVTT